MMGVWSPSLGSQAQGFRSVARLQSTLPWMVTSACKCFSSGDEARPTIGIRARMDAVRMPMRRCWGMPYSCCGGMRPVADHCGFDIRAPSTSRRLPAGLTDPPNRERTIDEDDPGGRREHERVPGRTRSGPERDRRAGAGRSRRRGSSSSCSPSSSSTGTARPTRGRWPSRCRTARASAGWRRSPVAIAWSSAPG